MRCSSQRGPIGAGPNEPLTIDVSVVPLEEILPLRDLYRKEMNCQIVHDSWHARGFTTSYLLWSHGEMVGYGSVGGAPGDSKDAIKEFYVLPTHRGAALPLMRRLIAASDARRIEAQTNDLLLTLMLYDCANNISRAKILLHDAFTTNLTVAGATFRKVAESDKERMSADAREGAGEWMIEVAGERVATGGILFHYNRPYGDVYMGVDEHFRRMGYGSYLVQELKRSCYEMGGVPAARCNVSNDASRATLQRAGFLPCAQILSGVISR